MVVKSVSLNINLKIYIIMQESIDNSLWEVVDEEELHYNGMNETEYLQP
jgi:hypothetical protein